LKAPPTANITVDLKQYVGEGSITEVASRSGSEHGFLYFDLPAGATFRMHMTGKKRDTKIDFTFYLGGSNKNYKMLRGYRDLPTSKQASALVPVAVEGTGYLTFTPKPMKKLRNGDPDSVVTTAPGRITLNEDNYPTK
jgi:hypothetical protein